MCSLEEYYEGWKRFVSFLTFCVWIFPIAIVRTMWHEYYEYVQQVCTLLSLITSFSLAHLFCTFTTSLIQKVNKFISDLKLEFLRGIKCELMCHYLVPQQVQQILTESHLIMAKYDAARCPLIVLLQLEFICVILFLLMQVLQHTFS